MLRVPNIRAVTGRPRLRLALILFAALVPVVALAVAAEAEILPSGEPTTVADLSGGIRTHSNADYAGAKSPPFSIPCNGCHVTHKAGNTNLLQAEGVAVCGRCHDLTMIHRDPATQQSVESVSAAAVPGDCLTCHPHSSGFMPATGAVSLTVNAQAMGYDDLDEDGTLSPGDRVHFRIDYANRGPEEVTGALLRSELDKAHVASVDEITGDGILDETAFAIQWDIGTLASGASGFVTHDAVLEDASAFSGDSAAPSGTGLAEPEDEEGMDNLTTTTRASERHEKTVEGHEKTVERHGNTVEGREKTVEGSATETVEISATESSSGGSGTETSSESSNGDTSTGDSGTETLAEDPTTTTTTAIYSSTPTTIATATAAAGPNDVIIRAVLTADDRDPVYATVVVSVRNDGLDSATSNSIESGGDTTTTSQPTTSTTLVVGPKDVVNTAVLTADTWEANSTSAVIAVVVPPPPEPEPQKTPVAEAETTDTDSTVGVPGEEPSGEEDLNSAGEESPGLPEDPVYREIDDGHVTPRNATLGKRALGYHDLDGDGNLSPGDRVRYLIYVRNLEPQEVTGMLLVDELDKTHVASVESITGGGTFDPTTFQITWDIGTLKALTSGLVMYEVVLRGSAAFGGESAAPARTPSTKTEDQESPDSLTTTTGTTEGPGADTLPEDSTTETSNDPATSATPTTAVPSGEPGPDTTGVPLAALAVLPLAGVAIRAISPRR